MKNHLFITALLFLSFSASAQFTTGQKVLSGQFSLYFNSNNNNTATSPESIGRSGAAYVSLSFSKFRSPSVITGSGVNYGYQHGYTNDHAIPTNAETKSNTHSIGLFVDRTRLETISKKFYFTYTGTIGGVYQFQKSVFTSGPTTIVPTTGNTYGVYASGGIGLLYQLNQRFLFSGNLTNLLNVSYYHTDNTSTDGVLVTKASSNTVGLTTGLQNLPLSSLMIGVKYMLKK